MATCHWRKQLKQGPELSISYRGSMSANVRLQCPSRTCSKACYCNLKEWTEVAGNRSGDPYGTELICPHCKNGYTARTWARIIETDEFRKKGYEIDDPPNDPEPTSTKKTRPVT